MLHLAHPAGLLPSAAAAVPTDVIALAGRRRHAGQLREILDTRFQEAIQYSRDYETVFGSGERQLWVRYAVSFAYGPRDWSRLIQRIEEFDFSKLDFDVIGQMYERLIGASERRRFGQFYTSPDVVDLINAFCIRSPDDRVLDPACGGGTFLVRAYARKRALAQSGR